MKRESTAQKQRCRRNEPDALPDNTGEKQVERTAQGQYAPGQSGNPAGRPRGSRNRAAMLLAEVLEGEAEQIGAKLVEAAISGEQWAMKLCVDRLYPAPKDPPLLVPVHIDLDDESGTVRRVAEALGAGELSIAEATAMLNTLEAHRKARDAAENADMFRQIIGRGI